MTTWALPAKGQLLPAVNPTADRCMDCGDFLAWCPVWCRRWPILETHREKV